MKLLLLLLKKKMLLLHSIVLLLKLLLHLIHVSLLRSLHITPSRRMTLRRILRLIMAVTVVMMGISRIRMMRRVTVMRRWRRIVAIRRVSAMRRMSTVRRGRRSTMRRSILRRMITW